MIENSLKVMVLWHCNPNPLAPPLISSNQITGVLEEYKNQDFEYGNSKFAIPRGEFDLEELLIQNEISKPDLLFVCMDSTTPYFARNIDKVCTNSFLCLGDSHHLPNPISRLINYAACEKFQGHIFTNNVRHAHWFSHYSTAQQYFEPALFALKLSKYYNPNTSIQSNSNAVFYGQIGTFHPRRKRIVPNLINAGLVKHIHGEQEIICRELQMGLACINVTLNSDLNSRVFEIAQTGCLQIVDELSIHNGHCIVLIPEHNCLTFKTEDELVSILRDKSYLSTYGSIMGQNLRHEYNSYWGIERIKDRLFMSINADSIKLNPVKNTRKKINSKTSIKSRLKIYEDLLEIHRCHESINLFIEGPEAEVFKNDASDLPRITFPHQSELMEPSKNMKILIRTFENSQAEIFQIV